MTADKFSGLAKELTSPLSRVVALTPSDSADLDEVTRAVYVGTSGDLVGVFADGSTFTFKNVSAGQVLPIRVKRVNATGTTATNLGAGY